ncbi:divalent-cation tolerance protein CutA [Natrialbaceae archaeon A-gly3]
MPTVYITVPREAADDVVEAVLEERLAACVNRFPIESTYRWEGEIHHDEETLLLAKTTEEAYDDLLKCVREVHPHDVPCIERFDEDHVLEAYAGWVDSMVDGRQNLE